MSDYRAFVVVPAAAAALLLSACGDGAPQGDAPPSSPATAGETTVAPEGQSGSDQQADLSFEDQSGAGDSVVVDIVSAPQGGFVVVAIDDDRDDDGRVLGSSQVPVGTTDDVAVALEPALTADTDLEAILYADTDGDGEFDGASDEAVPEPIDGGDPSDDESDDSDVVDDGASYSLG